MSIRNSCFIFRIATAVIQTLHKFALHYCLPSNALFTETENLSQEGGPDIQEAVLLATGQPSPEREGWDKESDSLESSLVDSSAVSGIWNLHIVSIFC